MSNELEDTRYLKLADGTIVNGSTGEASKDTSINKLYAVNDKIDGRASKAAFDQGTRRYIDDLRMPHQESRPYAIIAAYSLFGLNDADIAFILKSTPERINEYKLSKEYNHILDGMIQNVREHDKDKVRKVLNANAEKAAQTIVNIANDKLHKKQFEAAKDILERTGHSAGSETGETGKRSGILIQIIDDREKKQAIEIDDL